MRQQIDIFVIAHDVVFAIRRRRCGVFFPVAAAVGGGAADVAAAWCGPPLWFCFHFGMYLIVGNCICFRLCMRLGSMTGRMRNEVVDNGGDCAG